MELLDDVKRYFERAPIPCYTQDIMLFTHARLSFGLHSAKAVAKYTPTDSTALAFIHPPSPHVRSHIALQPLQLSFTAYAVGIISEGDSSRPVGLADKIIRRRLNELFGPESAAVLLEHPIPQDTLVVKPLRADEPRGRKLIMM